MSSLDAGTFLPYTGPTQGRMAMQWDVTIEGRGTRLFPGSAASDALYELWSTTRDYIGMGSVKIDPYNVNGLRYCRCTFPLVTTFQKIGAETEEEAAAAAMSYLVNLGINIDPTNWQAVGSE